MDTAEAERLVALFQRGWDHPGAHAWDELLDPDVELVQPMVPVTRGIDAWDREFARVQALLPDIAGTVHDWAVRGDTLFIHLTLACTVAGKPVSWSLVDKLDVRAGRVVRRVAHFDSAPLALAVLTSPRAWPAWWRAGRPGLPRR